MSKPLHNPIFDHVRRTYDQLASLYSECATDKAHNAHYDRPAVMSLLPEVKGLRVLDAGCGAGHYIKDLIALGAICTGVDVSPNMLDEARTRVGRGVPLYEADLEKPMEFFQDESFQLVVSGLVMSYLRDLRGTFGEFHRILEPEGILVFSTSHPLDDMRFSPNGDYLSVEQCELDWNGFGCEPIPMKWWRRPIGELVNPLMQTGFHLEKILEPKPIPSFRKWDPIDYAKLKKQPGFICVRARKAT